MIRAMLTVCGSAWKSCPIFDRGMAARVGMLKFEGARDSEIKGGVDKDHRNCANFLRKARISSSTSTKICP